MRNTRFYICIVRGRIMSESREREECELFNTTSRVEDIIYNISYIILHIIYVYVRYVQAELHRDGPSRPTLVGDSLSPCISIMKKDIQINIIG